MNIKRINGFADLLEPESTTFSFMEKVCRELFPRYGFKEIRVPILEYTHLYSRSIGTETDIVQKEMYTFPDSKGTLQSLRPEATAGIMRAYIDASLHAKEAVSKLFTYGPMFRCERPQKGRMRQFHQIDGELIGAQSPVADAEVISLLMQYVQALGLSDLTLRINNLGCTQCRAAYKETLVKYFRQYTNDLCEDCQRRLEKNPLRVLDCKKDHHLEIMMNAPVISDYVCPDCREHYAVVIDLLQANNIPFEQDHFLVRGLDYYCRTTFELQSNKIGAQTAVAGGGRYDGLIKTLGGPDVPGIGFACGMERLALLLNEQQTKRTDFYVVCFDQENIGKAFAITHDLRLAGLAGEMGYAASGMKSAMRQAGKSQARFAIIMGSDEVARNVVALKNMDSGQQCEVAMESIAAAIREEE